MDHSPGQRRFVLESKYRAYYMGKFQLTTAQMEAVTLRADLVQVRSQDGLPVVR